MITSLTKQQEKAISEYYNKYLKMGLRTMPLDHKNSFRIIDDLYREIGRKPPMKFVFDSPMACLFAYAYLDEFFKKFKNVSSGKKIESQIESQIRSQIESQIGSQIRSQIWSQIRSQIWSQIGSQIESQIRSQIESQIGSQIGSQIRSQIGSQIESQIESQIRSQIESQIRSQIRSQIWSQIESQIGSQIESQIRSQIESQIRSQRDAFLTGNHWCGYMGYYQYFKDIFGFKPQNDSLMETLNEWVEELHWFLPYENICIMSEHPIEINRNSRGLHADGKAALKYKDGYSLWSLNGVRVPEYLAKTPESELDIKFFNEEKNADIKAEFIRKYGIDRMKSLGRTVDIHTKYRDKWFSQSQYELIDMSPIFTNVRYAPHLWMKNLTTGIHHLEAVGPDCKTISDAIEFRWNGRKLNEHQIGGIK